MDNQDHYDTPLLSPSAGEPVVVSVEEEQQQDRSWPHVGKTPWLLTTAILLSDMFGLGTLSLPADFARLGWIPALLCFAWFALSSIYSGWLYQRLSLRVPRAMVFDEVGKAAMGTAGSAMVYGTVYMTILCEPIIFHLTCMETLQQVSQHASQMQYMWQPPLTVLGQSVNSSVETMGKLLSSML
eukprot:GHRR01021211.1.p1 GENE.GHRR01021211.1~~GHRR01021211.1.p1  ORF type:complete len:184 (+),score=39.00 GHRR01021211.1:394-945(+)